MTSDVFDRLLEHTLRDELARPAAASGADLAARVVAALASGVASRPEVPLAQRERRRVHRGWLPFVIAAAAVVGVASTWLATKQAGLSCSQALLLAAGDDASFTMGKRVLAASLAWCTGAEAVVLTAGDGTAAEAAPGCAFAIDPQRRSAELLAGALELRARRTPWRVDVDVDGAGVSDATVLVADGCAVRCLSTLQVPFPTDPTDPTMTPNDLRARLRDLAVPATFTVLVLAGTAELATAQGKEVLPAGASRTIDVGSDRAAAGRALQLYPEVRKQLPVSTGEQSMIAAKEQDEQFQELVGLVLQWRAPAIALRHLIVRDLDEAKLGAEPVARVLQLALLDEHADTFTAVTRLWSAQPERFGFEAQVALAERGFAPAMTKLRESLAPVSGAAKARGAAALVAGGDEATRGRMRQLLLADLAAAGQDAAAFDARCFAAHALQEVGILGPVRQLRTSLVAQIETWIASGDAQQLALAAWCLQRGEYWLGAARPRLSWVEQRVRAASPQRGEPDAASLRARAAALPVK